MTREEITALAERSACRIGYIPGTVEYLQCVGSIEIQIEIDLEILHDISFQKKEV